MTKDRSINIFLLDYNVTQCAKYHCDKHVVKMPLESTQMLSTVHWRYENYIWLWKLGIALCKEYTYRYEKVHACERVLAILRSPPILLKERGVTKHPQAMPDEYKCSDPIQAYHDYYINEKARICSWKKREIPPFMAL